MRKLLMLLTLCLGMTTSAMAGTVALGAAELVFENAAVIEAPFEGYAGESVFEDVEFIKGTKGIVSNLGQVDAGWYQLTLTDFNFAAAFEDLRVAITTATQLVTVLQLDFEADQSVGYVELTGGESYYLSVYGVVPGRQYGLYGVELSQFIASPVPVPASLVLLLSGLVAWGATGLRRKAAAGRR